MWTAMLRDGAARLLSMKLVVLNQDHSFILRSRRSRRLEGRDVRWGFCKGVLLGALVSTGAASGADAGQKISWRRLDTGLEFARVASPQRSYSGDSIITVVRVDPRHYRFQLVTARAHGKKPRTVADWATRFRFAAAINAGLFARDYSTSIGLMVNYRRVNNPRLSGSKTVLAFNRKSPRLPRAQIIDRTCQNFGRLRRRYHTLVQSIRLIGCRGRVVWKQSDKRWSMAVIASDRRRRMLLIHTRSPYSAHDFGRILQRLPLGVARAMYLEGGRAATLYVNVGGVRFQEVGTHGTTAIDVGATSARPIPNVIGIVKRR